LGFLGINDTITHKGEGFVNYTIKPRPTSKTGDSIRAQALIVFDDNPPINTPRIHNLIDAVAPTSYIKSMASVIDSAVFHLNLAGNDDNGGSGLANFDIYTSENNGAYSVYAKGISDSVISFKGNFGSSYKAYTIASDNTANRETKSKEDVTFTIASKYFFKPLASNTSLCSGDTLTLIWFRSVFSTVDFEYSADSGKTYTTFASNINGSDTMFKWRIPSNITGIKNYFIRAISSGTSNIIDTSDIFELKQGPAVNLGPDTAYCDGSSFNYTLDAGSGFSSYKWTDNSTNQTLSVNTHGTYGVTVTAATGCKASDEVIVSRNLLPVVFGKVIVSPKCYGDTTGSIDIGIASGHAPFSYLWTNNKTTEDISNLAGGQYIVSVTDSKGCNIQDTSIVTQPSSPLTLSNTKVNVNCFGNSTGSIDLSVSGGTSGYSYAWSASAGGVIPSGQSTSQDLNGLVAGTYTVLVTDANNCVASASISITQPSAPLSSSRTQLDVLLFW
jgi:hypothetical protein